MGLEPTPTRRTITVANAVTAGCKGFFKEVPVTSLEEIVRLEFPVVDGVPVDVLTWLIDLERLEATLDLREQFVDFNINKRSVKTEPNPETGYVSDKNAPDEYVDFITESSSMDASSQSESNEEDSLVVSVEKDVCEPMLSKEEVD